MGLENPRNAVRNEWTRLVPMILAGPRSGPRSSTCRAPWHAAPWRVRLLVRRSQPRAGARLRAMISAHWSRWRDSSRRHRHPVRRGRPAVRHYLSQRGLTKELPRHAGLATTTSISLGASFLVTGLVLDMRLDCRVVACPPPRRHRQCRGACFGSSRATSAAGRRPSCARFPASHSSSGAGLAQAQVPLFQEASCQRWNSRRLEASAVSKTVASESAARFEAAPDLRRRAPRADQRGFPPETQPADSAWPRSARSPAAAARARSSRGDLRKIQSSRQRAVGCPAAQRAALPVEPRRSRPDHSIGAAPRERPACVVPGVHEQHARFARLRRQ